MVERKGEPLLKTKLSAPQLRANRVARPRLFNLLAEATSRALTLICAPAGSGKTSLLAEWISIYAGEQPQSASLRSRGVRVNSADIPISPAPLHPRTPAQFAWLSLDEGDNDLTRFLGYLVAALENVEPPADGVRFTLSSFPPPSSQVILTLLINQLQQLPCSILLVLDDYQFISNAAIHEAVTFFLEHLPSNAHLVIATRSDPPLPLARLRARNQLLEVRADQLRFTSDEAAAFLNQAMNLSLSTDDIAALEDRTEGWIAGLQMAAIAVQARLAQSQITQAPFPLEDREDIHRFIQAFSGSHRYIIDYLAEEVFIRQPEYVQHFLLNTSILDRLHGDLCNAVIENGEPRIESSQLLSTLGSPFSSSNSILEYLDRANLFLVALDDQRRWYRYHHLFADLLRARLYQSWPDRALELHRRASAWFEQNGFPSEAIQHALSAREFLRAAELIDRYGTIRWSRGDPVMITLASLLPTEILNQRPKLGICQAWTLIAQGQSPAAFSLLKDLRGHLPADASPESVWMPAFIDLLYAFGALQSGTQAHAPIPDYHALELIPEQDVGLREVADYLYAVLLNRQGEFDRSAEILDRFVRYETAANDPRGIFLAIALLARTLIMLGRLPDAAALCREYLTTVSAKGKRTFYAAGSLNIILGEVLCEWNQLEEAENQIREGIRDNEPWNNITFDAIGYSDLVSVQLARGDLNGALDTMGKLEEMLQGRALTLDLEEELWTYKVRVWLAKGDLASAEAWANRISLTDPQDFLQEWGRISLARVRIAQSRYQEAQGIVEALLRLPGSAKRIHRQVRVYLFLAIAFFYQNQLPQSLQALDACLALTEPGGYVRTFLNSGEPVREILTVYLRTPALAHKGYAQKLLEAFRGSAQEIPTGKTGAGLVEPLTRRELEVLHLLAEGCSNNQIAEKLILAEGTVKFYVHTVLEKLEVHSRTQAIAKARELNLI